MTATLVRAVCDRLGSAERTFECCDTTFTVRASGRGAARAVDAAERTARSLEAQLNAFDDDSAVAELNATGRVTNPHVAAVVRRGLEYASRTDGAFDVRQGAVEHALKAYIRGDSDDVDAAFVGDGAGVTVSGDTVETDAPLDLNGLAKGYIVDRAADALDGRGRYGFVDGGGDISSPTGPVAVESPFGDARPLAVLDTDWHVATSGGYRRQRDGVNHIYAPRDGTVGTGHDSVTVVARRDCTEADALATAVSALPVEAGLRLVEGWDGAEALLVHGGVFHRSAGFQTHVAG